MARNEPDKRSERDGTNRSGGEVPRCVRFQPDLGPHWHGARDLRAFRQRQGGILRSPEHEPRTFRDEQPDHGHLLRPGRSSFVLV